MQRLFLAKRDRPRFSQIGVEGLCSVAHGFRYSATGLDRLGRKLSDVADLHDRL